jgi:hypothetical protein
MNKLSSSSNKKTWMDTNVILTFNSPNRFGDTQEIFDLALPIATDEHDAISFIDTQFFKRVVSECKLLNRPVEDLLKISTASDWKTFEEITDKQSLCKLGHDCKWYFNHEWSDLDDWELSLISKYKFGINT